MVSEVDGSPESFGLGSEWIKTDEAEGERAGQGDPLHPLRDSPEGRGRKGNRENFQAIWGEDLTFLLVPEGRINRIIRRINPDPAYSWRWNSHG